MGVKCAEAVILQPLTCLKCVIENITSVVEVKSVPVKSIHVKSVQVKSVLCEICPTSLTPSSELVEVSEIRVERCLA